MVGRLVRGRRPVMNEQSAEQAVIRAFADRDAQALFVTELQFATAAVLTRSDLDAVLSRMAADGSLIVVQKPAPDPHLAGTDLRIVAPASARAAGVIEDTWRAWLREFLSSHRCT
jgi:hypothetical protein